MLTLNNKEIRFIANLLIKERHLHSEGGIRIGHVEPEVANEVCWVYRPHEGIKAREGLTDAHVADDCRGVLAQFRVIEDRDRHHDSRKHRHY